MIQAASTGTVWHDSVGSAEHTLRAQSQGRSEIHATAQADAAKAPRIHYALSSEFIFDHCARRHLSCRQIFLNSFIQLCDPCKELQGTVQETCALKHTSESEKRH